MKKIDIRKEKEQIVVPQTEKVKLKEANEIVQRKHKELGVYKKYDNKPEEKIPEFWMYQFLAESLPNWNIEPVFLDVGKIDIVLKHKEKPIEKKIEIKTKLEAPKDYIRKYNHPYQIDRSAGVPADRISQVLDNADFTLWFRTSKFCVVSGYTASSTQIDGITEKGTLQIEDFQYVPPSEDITPYYYLKINESKDVFSYIGMDGLHDFIKTMKKI